MDDIARNLQDALVMLIDEQEAFSDLFPESDMPDVRHVETFEHAGVMTTDAGVVLRFVDGSEYQITIVRSR